MPAFTSLHRVQFAAALVAAAVQVSAWAHGDESHDTAPPALGQAVAPRADAHSEVFELLIVAEGEQLRLYLDDFASNAPISGARIEVERGTTWKAQAREHAPGEYLLKAPWLNQPGAHPRRGERHRARVSGRGARERDHARGGRVLRRDDAHRGQRHRVAHAPGVPGEVSRVAL